MELLERGIRLRDSVARPRERHRLVVHLDGQFGVRLVEAAVTRFRVRHDNDGILNDVHNIDADIGQALVAVVIDNLHLDGVVLLVGGERFVIEHLTRGNHTARGINREQAGITADKAELILAEAGIRAVLVVISKYADLGTHRFVLADTHRRILDRRRVVHVDHENLHQDIFHHVTALDGHADLVRVLHFVVDGAILGNLDEARGRINNERIRRIENAERRRSHVGFHIADRLVFLGVLENREHRRHEVDGKLVRVVRNGIVGIPDDGVAQGIVRGAKLVGLALEYELREVIHMDNIPHLDRSSVQRERTDRYRLLDFHGIVLQERRVRVHGREAVDHERIVHETDYGKVRTERALRHVDDVDGEPCALFGSVTVGIDRRFQVADADVEAFFFFSQGIVLRMQNNRVCKRRMALFEMSPYRIAVFTKREVRIDNVVAVGVLGAGIVGGLVQEFVAVAERHPGRRFQTQVQEHRIANVFVVFTKFFVHLELGREELHIAEVAGIEIVVDLDFLGSQKLACKAIMVQELNRSSRNIRPLHSAFFRRENNIIRRVEKHISSIILIFHDLLRTAFPSLS